MLHIDPNIWTVITIQIISFTKQFAWSISFLLVYNHYYLHMHFT